ncbi:sce7725 family protein [Microbacterium aurum]|uniref:sce7725 family protein n=1 Tax=Microbacterium aurum TaxID=36805 RepID=UPI0012F52636|nr:sce7725 family protein [Microbacterium aurum]MBM7826313.1 hypothetical protein [Microbacterium aurum]
MYFPYLYGLASELLALRDLIDDEFQGPLHPIIEPVRADASALNTALRAVGTGGFGASVVVNPSLRDFQVPAARASWWEMAGPQLSDGSVRPALVIDSHTRRSEIEDFERTFDGGALTVVVRSGAVDASMVAGLLEVQDVLVVVHHNVDDAAYSQAFGPSAVVRLTDSFRRQPRNADYEGSDWFSDGHRTYGDGGRPGFGDYTVLAPTPSDPGGGPAAAVVVHASYLGSDGDLWVAHYVSDAIERGEGSAGEKLLEALDHLAVDRDLFDSTSGMLRFDELRAVRRFTNLATNKRHQISHHIAIATQAARG